MKPKLLDLYCKAGGCSRGYVEAGFEVTGVDIAPQPNYLKSGGTEFIQANALDVLHDLDFIQQFDVIHASPPCQQFSLATVPLRLKGKEYNDTLAETRELLLKLGTPYIMENVPNAPMRKDLVLWGIMFQLKVLRKRIFELGNGLFLMQPIKGQHRGTVKSGDFAMVVGNGQLKCTDGERVKFGKTILEAWSIAMGIDWMNRDELREAIPPAYTKYIGERVINQITTLALCKSQPLEKK